MGKFCIPLIINRITVNIDSYFVMGGELEDEEWRTLSPLDFYTRVSDYVTKRLN
jgi:hypothetical protein